jgi:hypothetical protein
MRSIVFGFKLTGFSSLLVDDDVLPRGAWSSSSEFRVFNTSLNLYDQADSKVQNSALSRDRQHNEGRAVDQSMSLPPHRYRIALQIYTGGGEIEVERGWREETYCSFNESAIEILFSFWSTGCR